MLNLAVLNTRLFEFVNGAAGYYHPLDLLFIFVTSYWSLAAVGLLVAYHVAIHTPLHKEGIARVQAFKRAGMIAISVAATFVVVSIIKVLVAFPRPFQTLHNLRVLISLPDGYSFPSAHAAVTMALATAVYFHHKRLGELLFAFAFVVGMARIYVGVHYPLDVGVGFLLGYVIPKLLHHFFVQKEPLKLQ